MYQPGTLYSPNYNSRVMGVGTTRPAHNVFTSKPGVGPGDLSLDRKSDAMQSSGRRTMGLPSSPRQLRKKDVYAQSNQDDLSFTQSSTSLLGRNLFDHAITKRMADDYSGNPIWSDAGKASYARVENNKDITTKPLIGNLGLSLNDERFNEEHFRLPAKFSPASRTLRQGCPDLGQRHPNGRPFANVTLAVPPQRTQGEDSTEWHYTKDMNSSHGVKAVSHRSSGGKYFRNSQVTGDTAVNTRTESINDRSFYDLGAKPRTLMGGGYSRAVKEREDALLNQRGRLKRVEETPQELLDATRRVMTQKQHFMVDEDAFNPRYEQDNSAYCTLTSEWQSSASAQNNEAKERLTGARATLERQQIEEANRRTTLFRRR